MITKKDLKAAGVQVGSLIEVNGKDKAYTVAFRKDFLSVAWDIHSVRAAINSQWFQDGAYPYGLMKSFKVLEKELGPVTKKELLNFGVKKYSKLELLVINPHNEKVKLVSYVASLGGDSICLDAFYRLGKPISLYSGINLPYENILFYNRLKVSNSK